MIIYMDVRGQDSWGLVAWDEGQEPRIIKGLGLAAHGAKMGDFADRRNIILHTRKATVGKVLAENSHPFSFTGKAGTFTGVHNGAVANHSALNFKLGRHNDVDSMHIYQHMAEGRNLEELKVRGALVWRKAEDAGRIYLCRLQGGAMEIFGIRPNAEASASTDVVFCSTYGGIKSALELAEVPAWFDYSPEDNVRYHLQDGLCYQQHTDDGKGLVKLSFGGNAIDYDYNRNNGRAIGYTRNFSDLRQLAAPGKAALKAYLMTKNTYLDAYYGNETCQECSLVARVKAKATGLRYCTTCWDSWEELASFKQMRTAQAGAQRFEVNDDWPTANGEILSCDWGCDSDTKPEWIIFGFGGKPDILDSYIICDDCFNYGVAPYLKTAMKAFKLKDLPMTADVTQQEPCEECATAKGVAFYKPRNWKSANDKKTHYWLCQEDLKLMIQIDLNEDKGEEIEYVCPDKHVFTMHDRERAGTTRIYCRWRGCTKMAVQVVRPEDKLLANNGGVLVGKDARKFIEAKTDEAKRKEIREHLVGALPEPKLDVLANYKREFMCPAGHLNEFVSSLDKIMCQTRGCREWAKRVKGGVKISAQRKGNKIVPDTEIKDRSKLERLFDALWPHTSDGDFPRDTLH